MTSGRSLRAAEAAQVAADHPIAGVGIGSQPLASQRLSDRSAVVSRFVSHTTPVTIVAELGVVGLLLYLALLAGAGRTIAVVHSRDRVFGLALAAVLLALFVHSLAYSGFLEDPITWLVFGLAAGAGARPHPSRPRTPLPALAPGSRWGLDERASGRARFAQCLLRAGRAGGPRGGERSRDRRRHPHFPSGDDRAQGPLAWLVRIADSEWDLGIPRAAALAGGVLVAVAGIVMLVVRTWRYWVLAALVAVVVCLLLVPSVLLQLGLRQSSAPWFFTNDSTYQIELAGELVLDGDNPYGHDYGYSGLERFYSFDGSTSEATRAEQVALRHLAYFPARRCRPPRGGCSRPPSTTTACSSCSPRWAWGLRRSRSAHRPGSASQLGAALAANPLAAHGVWFGVADAPSLLFVLLAFALASRSRAVGAGACLAIAILLKQFALVALPFLVVLLLVVGTRRELLYRAGAAFAGVLLAGFLPFVVSDAGALWRDTITYGADTYRILGYGLAGILIELGMIEERTDPYPFAYLAAFVWLPLTAWLVWIQLRARTAWVGAVAFSISMFVLLYLGRVLQNSYLFWPLAGISMAFLLAAAAPATSSPRTQPASEE